MPPLCGPFSNPSVPIAQALAAAVGGSIIATSNALSRLPDNLWKCIKLKEVPQHPGWRRSLLNTFVAVSCEYTCFDEKF